TAETISTDNSGDYTKVSPTELHKSEAAIQIIPGGNNAYISSTGTPASDSYTITATPASTGDEFTFSSSANGAITRTCKSNSVGKGCSTGTWKRDGAGGDRRARGD